MPNEYPEFWGGDESHLWQNISEGHTSDYGEMANDQHAIELFSAGWLEDTNSSADTQALRDAFFDYAIEEGYFFDREDFDWDDWREYMGY